MLTASVNFSANDATGITAVIGYPDSVSVPGSGQSASGSVTNLTGANGIFSVGDNDGDPANLNISVGLVVFPGPIPSGDFVLVEFVCDTGTLPAADQFSCTPDVSNFLGQPIESTCMVDVIVGDL